MSDFETALRAELAEAAPAREGDWDDVLRRARRRRVRRPVAVVALAAVALALGATALAETLGGGFSGWLGGERGVPASAEDRAELARQNDRSWAPLPEETDLRELVSYDYDGMTYRLLGFRTGAAVCLKVARSDADEGGDVACVAADELARWDEGAVPLAVDRPVREAEPGAAPSPLATWGLAADETRRVVLDGDDGRREAAVANGAFLLVGPGPVIEHTTLRGLAFDETGAARPLPLAPSATVEHEDHDTGLPLLGPAEVERRVRGGTIGWVMREEPRGEPVPAGLLDTIRPLPPPAEPPELLPHPAIPEGGFARLVRPDPGDFLAIVLGKGADGRICTFHVSRGGVGANCLPEEPFAHGPLSAGWTYAGAGSQFLTLSGVASDDVARLELFLGTGERREVPLRDNAFVARVHRARMPGRLIAYDADGRVVGISEQRSY